MFKGTLEQFGDVKVIGMDTISDLVEEDAGAVLVCASHGGVSSGSYACRYPMLAVFFNDAGVGKDDAGIAALAMLEEKGAPGLTYSHNSARIGDVQDAWANGIISHLNDSASKAGFQKGQSVQEALKRFAAG